MRVGVLALLMALAQRASAEPRIDASGFVGLHWFGDTQLGDSMEPEQVPHTAPVLGGRVGYAALALGRAELAVEGELALAAAFTGLTDEKMSYFAPVLGWHAHAIVRARFGRATVHALAGGGGETIASTSPAIATETDPIAYAGVGFELDVSALWRLRVDVRRGAMPGRDGATATTELQLGFSTRFGARPRPRPTELEPPPRVEVRADTGPPAVAPVVDPDGDGIIGAADACPDEREDVDGFADDDGCPELDNDGDGIPDAADRCPLEAETPNGFADDDGCADEVPDAVQQALAAAGGVRFEAGRARVGTAAKRLLEGVGATLAANPKLRITVVGHADKAGEELAKRRAEAVKWELVDQGLAEDRVEAAVGGAGLPPITIVLR